MNMCTVRFTFFDNEKRQPLRLPLSFSYVFPYMFSSRFAYANRGCRGPLSGPATSPIRA